MNPVGTRALHCAKKAHIFPDPMLPTDFRRLRSEGSPLTVTSQTERGGDEGWLEFRFSRIRGAELQGSIVEDSGDKFASDEGANG